MPIIPPSSSLMVSWYTRPPTTASSALHIFVRIIKVIVIIVSVLMAMIAFSMNFLEILTQPIPEGHIVYMIIIRYGI